MQNSGSEMVAVEILPGQARGLAELVEQTKMPVEKLLAIIIPHLSVTLRTVAGDLTASELEMATCRATNETVRKIRKLRRRKQTEMRVNVSAGSYGMLSEASIVLGCSVQKALESYINHGDTLTEWSNEGFPL